MSARHAPFACFILPVMLTVSAGAQPGGPPGEPRWIALDAAPPGTPPSVALNPTSDQRTTILDITLHGFFVKDVIMADGGVYQSISLPAVQTPAAGDDGKPDLPAIPILIGVPTDAVPTRSVQVTNLVVLEGYSIAPRQPDFEMLPDGGSNPPPFMIDLPFYDSTSTPYPPSGAVLGAGPGEFYGINVQALTFNPISVVPATRTLRLRQAARLTIAHDGAALPPQTISARHGRELTSELVNFPTLQGGGYVAIDTRHYDGYFLFVTTNDALPRIQPLIDQKNQRGFSTEVALVAPATPFPAIKSIIQNWYGRTPHGSDKFVILGGNGTTSRRSCNSSRTASRSASPTMTTPASPATTSSPRSASDASPAARRRWRSPTRSQRSSATRTRRSPPACTPTSTSPRCGWT